jgi:cellulose synthase/poly-beta-1,6-N-acetylglucosamine synthase-like glycosyltransferase
MQSIKKASVVFKDLVPHVFSPQVHADKARQSLSSTSASYSEVVTVGLFSMLATVLLAVFFYLGSETIFSSLTLSAYLGNLLIAQSAIMLAMMLTLSAKSLAIKKSNVGLELFLFSGFCLVMLLPLTSKPTLFIVFLASAAVVTASAFIQRLINKSYSFTGHLFYLVTVTSIIVGLLWGMNFFVGLEVSLSTRVLLMSSVPFLVISLPSNYLRLFEVYDVLTRDHWKRPRYPFPSNWHKYTPFVSIHVPTYSEPPEVVIETLDKLSNIHYENYEVIVIDNNTEDPTLWQPLRDHCKKLGSKFRFMHEMEVSGAKGGALNLIHQRIDPRAEILAIIDADYQVEPDFLLSLVGYFQNPKVGFVQTPHDYRDWQRNAFLKMCYWEYQLFFHTAMVGLNERDAGITVGTMCLVRKQALEEAGGWSEWCVTEDSELAIRIHDAGYTSVYVGKTYGRGLIPDSFEDYKKQRYRWTAGPVQEFRHYFTHFIGVSGRRANFSFFQRLFHLNHGLGNFLSSLGLPMIVIGLATITSMILNNEIVPVPFELWLAATISIISTNLLIILLYRVTLRATIMDILAQSIAASALTHVVYLSSIRTAISGNAKWTRTSKFRSSQSYADAIHSTLEETTIALLLFVFIIVALVSFPYSGLSTMLVIGVFYIAVRYLAAPLLALVAVHENKKHSSIQSRVL